MLLHGIAKENGEFDFIELEDDEYIGEEVTVLYDEEFNIIMIQRNKNSLSPSGLEKYFTGVLDNGTQIQFLPIPMPEELKSIKPSQEFRKLSLGFSPTNIDDEILNQVNKPILDIIRGSKELGALRVMITLSLGNSKKNESLSKEGILNLSQLDSYEGFNKVQVNKRENEDTIVETVDLIAGKLNDIVTMETSRNNPIKYERVIIEMELLYNKRREIFEKLFK